MQQQEDFWRPEREFPFEATIKTEKNICGWRQKRVVKFGKSKCVRNQHVSQAVSHRCLPFSSLSSSCSVALFCSSRFQMTSSGKAELSWSCKVTLIWCRCSIKIRFFKQREAAVMTSSQTDPIKTFCPLVGVPSFRSVLQEDCKWAALRALMVGAHTVNILSLGQKSELSSWGSAIVYIPIQLFLSHAFSSQVKKEILIIIWMEITDKNTKHHIFKTDFDYFPRFTARGIFGPRTQASCMKVHMSVQLCSSCLNCLSGSVWSAASRGTQQATTRLIAYEDVHGEAKRAEGGEVHHGSSPSRQGL